MKPTAVFSLVLFLAACDQTSKEEALKAEIDSLHREYEGARQELRLKKDSAKARDLSNDAGFLSRLTVAETRVVQLKQAVGQKKGEFRTLKRAAHPQKPSPETQ